jgi:hypothetical protein
VAKVGQEYHRRMTQALVLEIARRLNIFINHEALEGVVNFSFNHYPKYGLDIIITSALELLQLIAAKQNV